MLIKSFNAALCALAFVVVSVSSAFAVSSSIEGGDAVVKNRPNGISVAQTANPPGCTTGTVTAGCGRGGDPGTLMCPPGAGGSLSSGCKQWVVCPPGTQYAHPSKCVGVAKCPEPGTQPDFSGNCPAKPVCKVGTNVGPAAKKADGTYYCP